MLKLYIHDLDRSFQRPDGVSSTRLAFYLLRPVLAACPWSNSLTSLCQLARLQNGDNNCSKLIRHGFSKGVLGTLGVSEACQRSARPDCFHDST